MAHTITCSLGTVAGPVRVEAEENSARIADVTIRASGGNPEDWVGQSITIAFDGATIFTGKVNRPHFDAGRGLLRLSCSDLLQETFEAKTEAEILTAIPNGVWNRHIFGDREDGWQQALDVLSTWPGEVHLNASGSLITAAWNGGSGSYSFNASQHVHGSVRPDFARRRDIVNQVNITFEVRYTRRHHREHVFSWSWGHSSFCSWFQNSHDLPTREMVQSAAEGAVWQIQGPISFTALPDSGSYSCGSWLISDEEQRSIVAAAGWTAVRRWTQTITETYNLRVECTPSQTRYGLIEQEDSGSYQADYNDAAWDQDKNAETPSGGSWTVNGIGDYYSDEITRADADAAIECICKIASTRIKDTHRRNYVVFDVPCNPGMDIAATASVTNPTISATGKITQLVHQIDPEVGRAVTTVKIACSRGGGGSDDTITAPTAPDTSPQHAAPSSSTSLPTRIGGDTGGPAYDEDWTGYTGNRTLLDQGAETYPNRFRVVTPDIEDESRDEATGEVEVADATFDAGAPDDTLSIAILT